MARRLYPQARSQSANWIWGCMSPQIRPQVLKKCMLSLPRLDFGIVLLVAYLQYKIDSPCPWGTEKAKKQRTCEWNKIRIKLVNGGNGWGPAERGWLLGRQAGGHGVHSFLYPTLYQQHNYQNNHNQQPTTNTFTTASSTLCTNMSNTELKKNVYSYCTDVASAGPLSPPPATTTTSTVRTATCWLQLFPTQSTPQQRAFTSPSISLDDRQSLKAVIK
jgi:hypothetical protein